MAAPIIRSSGSVSGVVTGAGRNDLDIGETVTFTDSNVANTGATYLWTLEDKPIGCVVSLVNPTTAAPTLAPDVTGSYRIKCVVNGIVADTQTQVVAVPLAVSGARIPSFNERLEYTGGGNNKGWHETMTAFMRTVDVALGSIGVAADVRASVSATDTTAGFLNTKLLVTAGHLTKTTNSPGGNETLTFGLATVGPGAAVYGGGANFINSLTLDAQGRVTGLAAAAPPAAGANALGTYIVQTSANQPTNAQVLGSLATGFAKVTTATGVVSTQATIATADIANNAVTLGKMAQLAALSVLGNGTNGTADMAALTAGTDGHVLRRSGTAVGFGTLAAGAFADTTIVGARLSGFTNNTIPIGNSSTQLTNSTLTLASNVLTHTASSSGAGVSAQISNSSNTASSTANLSVLVGGATAGNASVSVGVTGGATWHHEVDNPTNDRYQLLKGSTVHVRIDPAVTYDQWQYLGATARGVSLGDFTALGNTRNGSIIFGVGFTTGSHYLNIGPDVSGTAGRGVAGVYWDSANWQNAISWTHVAAVNTGKLALMENGGNVVIGSMSAPASLVGGLCISNGTSASSNPVGGGCFEVIAGALYWRGPTSAPTFLAPP